VSTGEERELATRPTVLVVEDDESLRAALAALCAREGFTALEAPDVARARTLLAQSPIDAVLVDLTLADGSGLELLGDTQALGRPEYVVVTGDATAETAVRALQRGALDYLTKPVDRARLRSALANVQRTRALRGDVAELRSRLRDLGHFGGLVGRSEPMRKVYELIERVAATSAAVFITGESGTGKERVAEAIHQLSERRNRPFLAVNCGAMAPSLVESELFGHERGAFTGADRRRTGHFERAHGGSLFLDEITEMPLELQVKLLRVLESGALTRVGSSDPVAVDVRVLAASNRDPAQAVAEGRLREDLLYRLNVFPIHLPPLRARPGDVGLLAEHFLARVNARDGSAKRFSLRALAHLETLAWPGNVRELGNVVERAAILADGVIDVEVLPATSHVATSEDLALRIRVGTPLADAERRLILATLEALGGRKQETATALGISLKTLYNRLNVYQGAASGPPRSEPIVTPRR
jgi:DNA-binding NtrC family response regulator